jgi:guanyl-specific ribonuclease Sa
MLIVRGRRFGAAAIAAMVVWLVCPVRVAVADEDPQPPPDCCYDTCECCSCGNDAEVTYEGDPNDPPQERHTTSSSEVKGSSLAYVTRDECAMSEDVIASFAPLGTGIQANDVITDEGEVCDVGPTLERIKAGGSHPHVNDGTVFINKEGLLPTQPLGYYREWVHPTPGVTGAGPQRIVTGSGGELYYTPDHYQTFIPLN